MKKYWFLACLLALFVAPTLVGCDGGQVSQDAAREQVERDAAREAGQEAEYDEPAEDEVVRE